MTVLAERDRAIVAAAIGRTRGGAGLRVSEATTGLPTGMNPRPRKSARVGNPRSASTFTGACLYCGGPSLRSLTCVGHADLPALDAAFMAAVTTNTNGSDYR